MGSKKQYNHELKAKLALELLSGNKSVIELSSEHKVPQTNLHDWKNKLIFKAQSGCDIVPSCIIILRDNYNIRTMKRI